MGMAIVRYFVEQFITLGYLTLLPVRWAHTGYIDCNMLFPLLFLLGLFLIKKQLKG